MTKEIKEELNYCIERKYLLVGTIKEIIDNLLSIENKLNDKYKDKYIRFELGWKTECIQDGWGKNSLTEEIKVYGIRLENY